MHMGRLLLLLMVACCRGIHADEAETFIEEIVTTTSPAPTPAPTSPAAPQTVDVTVDAEAVQTDGFRHTLTACDTGDCVSGGCHFERCTTPVSCSGGLCVFKRCKTAVCEGGLCVFDATEAPSCPGGGCRFHNVARTLQEGYCTGGACRLEDEPHPTRVTETLST